MRTISRGAAIAVLLACIPAAAAGQTPALEQGTHVLGGSAGFSISQTGADDNAVTIALLPHVEYFVVDGLALGGQLGFIRTRVRDDATTSFHVGPVATYYLVQEGSAHPFVRAAAAWQRTSFEHDVASGSNTSLRTTGSVGLLYLLSEAVGVEAELYLSRAGFDNGFGQEVHRIQGGLRIGVAAFLP